MKWDLNSINKRCSELGIKFLDDSYKWNIKSKFQCKCGNTFERTFLNVNGGSILCDECYKKRQKEIKLRKLKENFEKFKEFVKDNSNCKLISDIEDYKSNKSKLKMECSCGELFFPTANNFMRGHTKCASCAKKETGISRRKSIDEIKEFVEKENETLIGYKFEKEHRLIIKCEKHGAYEVSYRNFYSGCRCPICKESKGEKNISDYLDKNNINYIKEYTIDGLKGIGGGFLRFDFAVSINNNFILIEYDGEQHFKPKFGEIEFKRTIKNDKIKNSFCKENNIHLFRIKYTEFENIENILNEIILHANTEITV